MKALEGQRLGEYEVLAKLGQGGMGAVYQARQSSLDRLVALKLLPTSLGENADYIARFRREAKVAASLNHPNIVQVYSAGACEGQHYFAMEYVDGETLQRRLERKGRIEPEDAVALALHAVRGLDYAWRKAKVIHRDIKPDNLFITAEGDVKLGDLGLAKEVDSRSPSLTATDVSLGTPHYVSPEQVLADPGIDFRADIYSLGCTLFHALAGRHPYSGPSAAAVMMKHVNEPPPDIRQARPDCPEALARVLDRMLRKNPAERYASYDELSADLLRVGQGQAQPGVPTDPAASTAASARPAARRRPPRAALAAAACATVALALGVAVLLHAGRAPLQAAAPAAGALESGAIRLWDSPESIAEEPGVRWLDGAVYFDPSDAPRALKCRKPLSRDAVLRAEVRLASDAAIAWLSLRFSSVPLSAGKAGDNGYRIDLSAGGRELSLKVMQASAGTRLQTWPVTASDRWVRLELRATGDEISVLLDGALLGTVRDASIPGPGGVLIYGMGASVRNIVYVPLDAVSYPGPQHRGAQPGPHPGTHAGAGKRLLAAAGGRGEAAALLPDLQVRRAVAELRRLNPGYDGRETHTIQDGRVTAISLADERVTDYSPLRALPALETINGVPAAEFWKRAGAGAK